MNMFDSDILVNLDGSFVIPRVGLKPIVGEINPDLRLQHLDAFLEQLSGAFAENRAAEARLTDGFASVIKSAKSDLMDAIDGTGKAKCMLRIGCTLDPLKKSFQYTFEITANQENGSE